MDDLAKRLTRLNSLLKAIKPMIKPKGNNMPTIPSIKPPSPPSMTPSGGGQKTKMVGEAPSSKKDPKKVAQQIKDGSMSTKTAKTLLKFEDNGQWSLNKASANPANEPKEAKIKQLQTQIDAGTYKPDAGKIAAKMLPVKLHKNGQWELDEVEKAVKPEHIAVSISDGDAPGVKSKKYQGGDPRHADDIMGSTHYRSGTPQRKTGLPRPEVSTVFGTAKLRGVTSGVSKNEDEVEKAELGQQFHIHKDGQQITAKPVTLDHVNNKYGSVQRLESSGHRLVPVKPAKIV